MDSKIIVRAADHLAHHLATIHRFGGHRSARRAVGPVTCQTAVAAAPTLRRNGAAPVQVWGGISMPARSGRSTATSVASPFGWCRPCRRCGSASRRSMDVVREANSRPPAAPSLRAACLQSWRRPRPAANEAIEWQYICAYKLVSPARSPSADSAGPSGTQVLWRRSPDIRPPGANDPRRQRQDGERAKCRNRRLCRLRRGPVRARPAPCRLQTGWRPSGRPATAPRPTTGARRRRLPRYPRCRRAARRTRVGSVHCGGRRGSWPAARRQ